MIALPTVLCHYERMTDIYPLKLQQIDGARGDLYGLAEEVETVKLQFERLLTQSPTRAYLCRTVLMATASVWLLIGAVALWMR
jgi:hypothetical protein